MHQRHRRSIVWTLAAAAAAAAADWLQWPLIGCDSGTFVTVLGVSALASFSGAKKTKPLARGGVAAAASSSLTAELQRCSTPWEVLDRVGRCVTPKNDPDGKVSSLILVRLSKLRLMTMNSTRNVDDADDPNINSNKIKCTGNEASPSAWLGPESARVVLFHVIHSLTGSVDNTVACFSNNESKRFNGFPTLIDSLVEGTKSYAILARLDAMDVLGREPPTSCAPTASTTTNATQTTRMLCNCWDQNTSWLISFMSEHHLSGVKWAWDSLVYAHATTTTNEKDESQFPLLPRLLQEAFDGLHLPFALLPGGLSSGLLLSGNNTSNSLLTALSNEVDFCLDDIRATTSTPERSFSTQQGSAIVVPERRFTAWQGDAKVGPFLYSGKSMPRHDWSPTVRTIRDDIFATTGQYYDACLLNLYPNGRSAMRYHSDPDQKLLWDTDTVVVSIGAPRRFAFRRIANRDNEPSATVEYSINRKQNNRPLALSNNTCRPKHPEQSQPHNFVVMHSDITYMFNDCQELYQHSVKNADNKDEISPRISLVFKRTWQL